MLQLAAIALPALTPGTCTSLHLFAGLMQHALRVARAFARLLRLGSGSRVSGFKQVGVHEVSEGGWMRSEHGCLTMNRRCSPDAIWPHALHWPCKLWAQARQSKQFLPGVFTRNRHKSCIRLCLEALSQRTMKPESPISNRNCSIASSDPPNSPIETAPSSLQTKRISKDPNSVGPWDVSYSSFLGSRGHLQEYTFSLLFFAFKRIRCRSIMFPSWV